MKVSFIYFAAILFVCCSCGGKKTQTNPEVSDALKDTPKSFVLPEIPAMYTGPEQRAEYLITHYWDNFDFTDTAYIHLPEITEQAYVDFLNITNHVKPDIAQSAMERFMSKTESNKKVFDYFVSLNDKYLYDPNSPYRNEELYIVALEKMLETKYLDETEKIRPKYRYELALKNRVGTKASDFTYTLESGKRGKLYNLPGDYILIYFNNPGCHACAEITEGIKQSTVIGYLTSEKRMTILGLYPDEELDEWKTHLSDFPSTWINGYDKETVIRDKNLYDLKAIPTLYLLDKNKVVLLKDATFQAIEKYLLDNISAQ